MLLNINYRCCDPPSHMGWLSQWQIYDIFCKVQIIFKILYSTFANAQVVVSRQVYSKQVDEKDGLKRLEFRFLFSMLCFLYSHKKRFSFVLYPLFKSFDKWILTTCQPFL